MNASTHISPSPQKNSNEVLVSVENVYKKFSKNIKKSVLYGTLDVLKNLLNIRERNTELRKKEFWALHDLSFQLHRGQILGILGLNGAGKTTLVRLISGIYPIDKGRISVNGRLVTLFAAVNAGMHPLFSGKENIFIRGTMFGMSKKEISSKLDEIIAFSELESFIDAPLGTYSSGMRARLSFSIAVASESDILILDEALAVGDISFRKKCFQKLHEISKEKGIISIAHNIDQIANLSTDILVLDAGKKIFETPDVSEGIDFYLRKCGTKINPEKIMTQRASLENIQISSTTNRFQDDILQLNYSDPMHLEFEYRLDADIREAIAQIQIFDNNKQIIAISNSDFFNFRLINNGKKERVHVAFNRMEFSPGIYLISVSLRDTTDERYLAMANFTKKFQIDGYFRNIARVHLNAEWKYLES
jgi:lipopolysaccharide transport system ATP-binding protein